MLYWSIILFLGALTAGLLAIAFTTTGARKILPVPYSYARWDWARYIPTWFRRLRAKALAAARMIRSSRFAKRRWQRGVLNLVICPMPIIAALAAIGFYHVYLDRRDLPDIEAFVRFEFPTIGTVYDANGKPLIELANEHRKITKYEDIPPIVRDAIIATEDKRFFSHSGVDYSAIPRVLGKVRIGALAASFIGLGGQEEGKSLTLLPQGGSTITQQLVRGHFLKNLTAKENSHQLAYAGILPRALSTMIGARSANMMVRKLE